MMRFWLLWAVTGLVAVGVGLLLMFGTSSRPPVALVPVEEMPVEELPQEGETAAWRALLTTAETGQPATLALPPLDFDAANQLAPDDTEWLTELGAMLSVKGLRATTLTFQLQTVTGRSSPEEVQQELDRINAAYHILARPAGAMAPAIAFLDPPADPAPLSAVLLAQLTIPEPPPEAPPPETPPETRPDPPTDFPPDPGPVEQLILGASLTLPEVAFEPGSATLRPLSAAMLADLGQRTVAVEAERFQIFIVPQTTPGLSPEAEIEVEKARFAAVIAALGDGWPGAVVFDTSPAAPLPLTDAMTVAITLTALPEADPPVWLRTPGAPGDSDAFGFGPGSQGEDFALTDPRLTTSTRGMVDFWTSPEWGRLNGYDPTLFSIGTGDQTTISLHMLDNRAGLAVWTGIPGLFLSVPHDFSANRPYHIALIVTPGEMVLMVDGAVLQPAIPLPVGAVTPAQIRLGNDAEGQSPYIGRIGKMRLWHQVPLASDLARIRSVDFIPEEFDPFAALASSVIWWNFETGRMEMRDLPPIQTPAEGWYATLPDGDVRMLNPDEFQRGTEAPVFSDMQDDWQNANLSVAARPVDPGDPGAFGENEDAQTNPSFAVRHAFRVQRDRGIDLTALQRPAPPQFDQQTPRLFEWGLQNWGLGIHTDAQGILAITQTSCRTNARAPDRWTCPDRVNPGQTLVIFDTDEYLTGIGWQMTDKAMRNLFFITNKRITPAMGGQVQPGEKLVEQYFRVLPAGVKPSSFNVYYSTAKARMIDFTLLFDPRHSRPGVTLISETGAAMRFVQEWADRLVSADGSMGFLIGLPGAGDRKDPRMFMDADGHLRIEGIAQALRLQDDHPAAQPGTAFNDTFVSLSKAVNLQASFMGYDAVEMDPLHLTRTGTHHPVFRMPDGDSRDYYDANRIFVPRGLHYFAEFTGKHHASVTTADTYSEYFDSFSDTVSFGIGGKKAPGSFSASATMSGAKKSIAEAKNSRTRALSRAVFYDLVLDQQHMQLDDLFASEAALLPTNGDYVSFVETFGTHYPVAVVYGGLGVLEIDATESMREQMRQKGVSIKLEASVMLDAASQTSASFGYEHESEHAETFRDVMGSQVENFYWIGGTHAGASNSGWTVGTDGVVPVHVQLRPLWELLSPLNFDDPAVYVMARQRLKDTIDRRISAAGNGLPRGVDDETYVVELRVDSVACTRDPASSMREPGQKTTSPGNVQLTAKTRKMFPMVGMVVFDGQLGLLRNLVAHQVSQTEDYKTLLVQCPSQTNLLERSPYAADNALYRYQMSADDILSGRASYSVLDRLDLESRVITPPVDQKSAEIKTKAFLAGLTLGISVLVDELTNDDGSPLVRAGETVIRPDMQQTGFNLRGQLCPPGLGCPQTRADLDRLSGQWIKKSVQMPRIACPPNFGPFPEFMCLPRRVDYSIRILK